MPGNFSLHRRGPLVADVRVLYFERSTPFNSRNNLIVLPDDDAVKPYRVAIVLNITYEEKESYKRPSDKIITLI